MERIELDETRSTNTWVREHLGELRAPVMVSAVAQSAGRGQRGNSWESAPGCNLTLSLLWRESGVPVREQFAISEAVAIAVCNTLRDLLNERGADGEAVKVKWPNDIYWNDKKICGILIEHGITGTEIDWSICGMGVNINQPRFESDAPNPVSMYQITGERTDLQEAETRLTAALERELGRVAPAAGREAMHREYLQRLWRGEGYHPYRRAADGAVFTAAIAAISPTGMLTLREVAGGTATYAFKEVAAVL